MPHAEMSEEALLCGGTVVHLVPDDHPGISEVKWCVNRFKPFLIIDPQPDANPGERDAEEVIELHRVTVERFRELLYSGDVMLPSMTTGFMGLDWLKENGYL